MEGKPCTLPGDDEVTEENCVVTTSKKTEDAASNSPSLDDKAGQVAEDVDPDSAKKTDLPSEKSDKETAERSDQPGKDEKSPKKKGKGRARGKKPDKSARDAEKEKADAERERLQDRLLRLQADFENFRKRTVREKSHLYQAANEDLITELLPVLDHFELALGAANDQKAHDAVAEGVRLVKEQLLTALIKFGLKVIDTEEQQFDPNLHEAISHMPSETVPDHGIMHETRKGYLLGDKLLRASQVVVSSGPTPEASEGKKAASQEAEGE